MRIILLLLSVLTVSAQDIYIYAGKIYDTDSGKLSSEKTIIISDNKIKSIENGYKELYDIYQGKGYKGDYFYRYRAIDIWGKIFQKLTLSKMKEEVKNSEGYIKLKVIKLI